MRRFAFAASVVVVAWLVGCNQQQEQPKGDPPKAKHPKQALIDEAEGELSKVLNDPGSLEVIEVKVEEPKEKWERLQIHFDFRAKNAVGGVSRSTFYVRDISGEKGN